MTWQAPGAPPNDPFAATEADVRALATSPWWMSAVPPQRAEAVTARMLAGSGEWWLFGIWGRWYRSGMDGIWHLCPPPFDPAARRGYAPVPHGARRPPTPASLLPSGPDLTPGPLAADGLFGAPPSPALMARLQQTLLGAAGFNAAHFPTRDPQFNPGTPIPVAVCLYAVLWCAGAPVADAEHPILGLFAPFLAQTGAEPHWFLEPALPSIVGAYTERLRAGDPMAASHIARTLWDTAEALRADAAFRPRADALSAMSGAALQLIQADHGGVRFGDPAVVQEWLRRCPPGVHVALLRETSPGDHFRLACYDLAAAAAPLPAAGGPIEARRAALALLAADLDGAPGSVAAVMPWLDPDSVRTLQALGAPGHPLRALWPTGDTLPESVIGAGPQILRGLLAASYAADLAWCRLAGTAPPRPGFNVPAALMAAMAAGPAPDSGLTPWEIIEAARAHLAGQRAADAPPAGDATTAWPGAGPVAVSPAAPAAARPDPHRPDAGQGNVADPLRASVPPPTAAWPDTGVPPATAADDGVSAAPTPAVACAYGITFLPGLDDVERMLTGLRRRGQWARSLRGQQVSSASAPAILLVGDACCGQRRLSRMIARALAEAGVSSGEVRVLTAEDLTDIDPRSLGERLAEHAGHLVLLDGLDTVLLAGEHGPAYASALYRTRGEGVSDVAVTASCAPSRLPDLTAVSPELIADFRTIRLPDLSDPGRRCDLASVLAAERHLQLSAEAWTVVRRDMRALRGRGRLSGARLVEAYLDRACSRHLSMAHHTQVFDADEVMRLSAADLDGVAGELEP